MRYSPTHKMMVRLSKSTRLLEKIFLILIERGDYPPYKNRLPAYVFLKNVKATPVTPVKKPLAKISLVR